jgi:tripartite-type tricarboxylate transporter receptor subunit TctC
VDVVTRIVAAQLSESFGQQVIVDNRMMEPHIRSGELA